MNYIYIYIYIYIYVRSKIDKIFAVATLSFTRSGDHQANVRVCVYTHENARLLGTEGTNRKKIFPV